MSAATVESPLERLSYLARRDREAEIGRLARARGVTVDEMKRLIVSSWSFQSRPKQRPPEGDWMYWYVMAGRGFGKTLTGAQWAKKVGLRSRVRIALIGPTLGDVRSTMIEGETGLLSILGGEQLHGGSRQAAYNRSHLELTLANGTIMKGFSSQEPERLRGPQHHYAWGEEVSSWEDSGRGLEELESTWSNLTLGLRLGPYPQACLTSTPKANKLTRELVAKAKNGSDMVLVRGSSYENRSNISEAYWQSVVAPLEGKRLGRQEIEAEVLDDVEGALWSLKQIDRLRVDPADVPPLRRIVVAVDPNASSSETADSAGIIVAGLEHRRDKRRAYILDDRTTVKGGPKAWAAAAVKAYHDWNADRIVAEINNGGEMVELALRSMDRSISYEGIHASRGKRVRAEPVSALYEGEDDDPFPPSVFHAGVFPELEEEMTTWVPADKESPNRMDALVWALTSLVLGEQPGYGSSHVPQGRIPGVDERYGMGVDFYS